MPKMWKVKAWLHDKMTTVLGIAILVAVLFGIWLLREPIMGVLSLIGIEMPG